MARNPKPLAEAVSNYVASVPSVPARYEAGIQRADWQTGASSQAAERNYAAGVQRAVASGSRAAGVRRVGNQQWQEAAISKGVPTIGVRMAAAEQKYAANFGPIYEGLGRVLSALPPRGIDPNANIDNRLKAVVKYFVDNRRRGR